MKNALMILSLSGTFLFQACSNGQTTTAKKDSTKTMHYLALGDSYTIGQSVSAEENFPHQLVAKANTKGFNFEEPEIIATTGWRTDQLIQKAASTKLKQYDLVTLLIGVNDEYQGRSVADYEPQFRIILDKAIQLAGNDTSKVWVFSIPDYGFTPYGQSQQASISKRLNEFNALNKKVALEKGVHYVEITEISRDGLKKPELVARDGLHPSGKMYGLWVDAFFSQFKP